jgi:hypothetical protein
VPTFVDEPIIRVEFDLEGVGCHRSRHCRWPSNAADISRVSS